VSSSKAEKERNADAKGKSAKFGVWKDSIVGFVKRVMNQGIQKLRKASG
jgi:hypothetical protein